MKLPQSSARMPMRFKHLAVLSLVLSVAACGQGGGADKGGKAHGGPGGGMPAAEVNVATVQPPTLRVPLEYTGQTAGSREVEVRARVTGIRCPETSVKALRCRRGS